MLLAVEVAGRYLGTWGVLAASIIAGVTDVDAITLALAGSAGAGMSPAAAAFAISAGVLSNTVAKTVYALGIGSKPFRRAIVAVLGTAFATGAAALVITRALLR